MKTRKPQLDHTVRDAREDDIRLLDVASRQRREVRAQHHAHTDAYQASSRRIHAVQPPGGFLRLRRMLVRSSWVRSPARASGSVLNTLCPRNKDLHLQTANVITKLAKDSVAWALRTHFGAT